MAKKTNYCSRLTYPPEFIPTIQLAIKIAENDTNVNNDVPQADRHKGKFSRLIRYLLELYVEEYKHTLEK